METWTPTSVIRSRKPAATRQVGVININIYKGFLLSRELDTNPKLLLLCKHDFDISFDLVPGAATGFQPGGGQDF